MSAANVRRQLDIERSLFGYRFHPDPAIDAQFADALALAIEAMGIENIRDIAFHRGTQSGTRWRSEVVERGDGYATLNIADPITYPVAWFYSKRTNARLFTATTIDADCVPGLRDVGDSQAWFDCPKIPGEADAIPFWTVRGGDRWVCEMFAAFTPQGLVYFLPKPYREQSNWASFREALTFFFAVASFAIPGIGAVIGQAVFGAQLAAAYPALVSIATNVALQTALGGGDIESAVTRAVAAYATGGLGDIIGAGVDSAFVGRLTAAATNAAITGGDITQAVAFAGLQYGATLPAGSAAVTDQPAKGDAMDYDDFNSDPGAFDALVASSVDFGDFNVATGGFDYVFDPMDMSGDPMFSGGDVPVNVPPLSPSEGAGTGSGTWNEALATISKTALTALQLYKAYESAGSPAPKTGLPSQVVNSNGTITTRSPNGTASTTKPAPGQPYVMNDGTLMLNNGDGTYTLIAPNGSRTTKRYADTPSGAMTFGPVSALSQQQLLVFGALGFGALYLFTRKKRRA